MISVTLNIDADQLAAAVLDTPAKKATPKVAIKTAPTKTVKAAAPKAVTRVATKAPNKASKAPAKKAVTVPITGRSYNRLTPEIETKLISALKANPEVRYQDLADELGVPRHTIVGWTRTLKKQGKL
jgi:hypothetical protein